jgi:uncharacterized protein YcbK (DUF882 family)
MKTTAGSSANKMPSIMSEQLTPNFRRSEFVCPCGCGFDSIAAFLVTGLQALRDSIQRPVEVLSGCRCPAHNAAVGGAVHSRHLLGQAADIKAPGMTAREVYAAATRISQFRGFGVDDERGFLHVDVRETAARWCYHHGRETAWHGAEEPIGGQHAG